MDVLAYLIDLALHLDRHLLELVSQYGVFIYAILFFIIFAETGFVVTPFLPGDSLIFVAGALAAIGEMNIAWLLFVLFVAALTGNMLNYQIGRMLGPRVFHWEKSRLFNPAMLTKTQLFYEKHGGKTLVISRFMPILRTFAPFVAGIGKMQYGRFFFFNFLGALTWVVSIGLAGFWFGNVPWIKKNLSLVIVGIIVLSLLPAVFAWLKERRCAKAA
ncbi:MAG: DedA family protein [Zoogloeaceae bacterium]|jgi:membrane-associated protein|nr:DedA family protein [Zoogloeaceae bacterium]